MYVEDGIEEDSAISFNLEACIYHLGEAAYGGGLTTDLAYQSVNLTLVKIN